MSFTGTHGKKATRLCPCGYLGDSSGRCRCAPDKIQRYRQRISGPLLDRIDLHVEVPRLPPRELQGAPGETSHAVRLRACTARDIQLQRQGVCNARLSGSDLDQHCHLQASEQALLLHAMERLSLSARAYHRILRVARTIADLDSAERIGAQHLSEAMAYRNLDRPL